MEGWWTLGGLLLLGLGGLEALLCHTCDGLSESSIHFCHEKEGGQLVECGPDRCGLLERRTERLPAPTSGGRTTRQTRWRRACIVAGEDVEAVLAGLGEGVKTELDMLLTTAAHAPAYTGCKHSYIGDSNYTVCLCKADGCNLTPATATAHLTSASAEEKSECFSGTSLVETPMGRIQMSSLRLGDSVLTHRPGIGPVFTKFLGWLDRNSVAPARFLHLLTTSGPGPTLTASHIIFRALPSGSPEPVYAGQLVPGDRLLRWDGAGLQEEELVAVEERHEISYWAPLTADDTLLVDGYFASCYAFYPHQVSKVVMGPIKLFPSLLLDNEVSQHEDGIRPVMMMNVVNMLGPRRFEQNKPIPAIEDFWPLNLMADRSEF